MTMLAIFEYAVKPGASTSSWPRCGQSVLRRLRQGRFWVRRRLVDYMGRAVRARDWDRPRRILV